MPGYYYKQKGGEKVKLRIILSIFLILLMFMASSIYKHVQGPIESEIAVGQLNDSVSAYALSRAIARDELILVALRLICIGLLIIIWLGVVIQKAKGALQNEKVDINHN